MHDARIVTEDEALADAQQRHQREIDAWQEQKARRERFVRWCKVKRPTCSQAYCDGSTMAMEQFLLQDEGPHGEAAVRALLDAVNRSAASRPADWH